MIREKREREAGSAPLKSEIEVGEHKKKGAEKVFLQRGGAFTRRVASGVIAVGQSWQQGENFSSCTRHGPSPRKRGCKKEKGIIRC